MGFSPPHFEMSRILFTRYILAVSCLVAFAVPANSQEDPPGLRFKSFGRAMHGRMQPGGWLALNATVSNTSDQQLTARVVAALGGFPDIQNSRTLPILPGTEESFEVYVQVPPAVASAAFQEVDVALYRVEDGKEVLLDLGGIPMRNNLRMQVEQTNNLSYTSLNDEPMEQFFWEFPFKEAYYNYEIVVSSRVLSGNTRSTVSFDNQQIPLSRMDWKDVGLITISETRFFEDATAVEALSQFINAGGRAWIMLDKIPCHLVQPLLGNANSCAELDQIELNRFSVEVASMPQSFSAADLIVDRDEPVLFKRVVQVGGTTSHAIDGWPAAIWMNVGYGEVLLTTLASAGWLRPGSESADPQQATSFRMTAWGMPLALDVHENRAEPPVSRSVQYPLELVGNPVLPRNLVGLVLSIFVVLLATVSIVSYRFGELSKLGFYAPLLSILAGCGLLLGSTWIRRDIPETLSRLQFIQVNENGRGAMVREQAAVHLSSERPMNLKGKVDGYANVDVNVQSGIKRFDVGDVQQWQLSNIAWPPGSWRYQTTHLQEFRGLVATGNLDANGLIVDLPIEVTRFEDPVIGFVAAGPMIGDLNGQQVRADGSMMAEADRWISGTLISDEQRRRIDLYQEFFHGDDRHLPPRNTIFGWTDPVAGAQWDNDELTHVGSALLGLPIRLVRPPVDQAILVPAGLVRLRKDPREIGQTSAFNEYTGKWSKEMALGINSFLQFVLPPQVLPFQATSLNIELNITAPHRVVRLLSRVDANDPIEIVSLDGPSVPWSGIVTDPRILADATDGTLDFLLEISERTDITDGMTASSVVTWQIDAFRASAKGSRYSEAEQLLTQ